MIIDILMATFNGEPFIEQQLRSLQAQTFKSWRLIIHDDGSTDHTVDIIKEIAKSDFRIVLVENSIKCGGAASNFMYLLRFVEAQYTMFCDQDDIWLDSKIKKMYDIIKSKNNTIPQVVYSNAYIWNSENNNISGSATITFPIKVEDLLFLNSGMQGCVSIFNKNTLNLLIKWENRPCAMHDHILHLIGISIGEVTYIEQNLMLYRQHDRNVTGSCQSNKNTLNRLRNRNAVVDKTHYKAVNTFLEVYDSYLSKRTLDIIKAYLKMPGESLISKIRTVLNYKFRIFSSKYKLILKILIRPYMNN